MVDINIQLANRKNYGNQRANSAIEYIVIHSASADGSSASADAAEYVNTVSKESMNYVVDNNEVIQSVPDNYVSFGIAGKLKNNTSGGTFFGACTNTNAINIMLSDTTADETIYPDSDTIQNALELVQYLMDKYNISLSHVIRCYDVNGNSCPVYWTDDDLWQSEFLDLLSEENITSENPYAVPTVTLKKGCSGSGVKWLEWELIESGYDLSITGTFDSTLETAVIDFQTNNELTANGIVGPSTRAALVSAQ